METIAHGALPRVAPLAPPYPPELEAIFRHLMGDRAPLVLFTTLARDARLFERFRRGSLLDRGHLTLRQREVVIDRITAAWRCEYEWGVHVALFGARTGLDAAMQRSLVYGSGRDPCWSADEGILLDCCDALVATADLDDALWRRARAYFSEEALIEIILLAGFYTTVSYLARALRLPLEPEAAVFPAMA